MKPILASTACFFVATVVCASLSNNELGSSSFELGTAIENVESKANLTSLNDFSPSTYGAIGAASLALLIAARRHKEQS